MLHRRPHSSATPARTAVLHSAFRILHSAFLLAALLPAAGAAGAIAETDNAGRITGLSLGGDTVDFVTNVRIPLKGWGRQPSLSDARDVKVTRGEGSTTWAGTIPVDAGKACRFEQTLREAGNKVTLELTVTAGADLDTEGVFLWVDAPRALFSGGECTLGPADNPAGRAVMPVAAPAEDPHFLSGTADRVSLADAAGRTTITMAFDRALPIVAQDTRKWQGTSYTVFCRFAEGLRAGESAKVTATLAIAGTPENAPARLAVRPDQVRYRLHGFGGNYCFGIESPVTQYTLQNLRVAWARTEMTPAEWEPANDNASPAETDWARLEHADKPDSNLRREFLLAKQIQGVGIPYAISIWHLPEWLYADPGKGPQAHGRVVPPEKWPELLECLGSYLLYAKRQYGVEPDLFSFNEADYGVRVKLTPEEHRDAIKSIGAHFRKLGLKTKMLLGDTAGPRGSHAYCLPAAADAEAMQYVGAVAFHSWGGATPEQYGAWGDLAERLKLPLLVAELGVDAGAWRTNPFDQFRYALKEAEMYQHLLLYARPQGTMQWEFTNDYSLLKQSKDAAGQPALTPTKRFYVVKHFCDLTPPRSDALSVASDHAKVLLTAFAGKVQGRPAYTFHVVNLGAARKATLAGLPAGITRLRAVQTSEADSYREMEPVPVSKGQVELDLAAQSLLTLTTLPGERTP